MKKAQIASLSVSAAMSIGAMVASTQVMAATGCTSGTPTKPVVCTVETGATAYVATQVNFTGSNDVSLFYTENTTGAAVCGAANKGTFTAYGLSTNGGSMQVKTGTALPTGATMPTSGATGGC